MGGTGFIGYHLAKRCLKKGWQVTSISTRSPKKLRFLSKVKYITCDITKKSNLKKKIKIYFDYVVNLGGYVDHTNKSKTFKSHYFGCKNLAEIFLTNPPKAFIQMGSSGEYGNLRSPQTEKSSCNPKSTYNKAKLLATRYLINLYKKRKFPCTILRLYQAYGPKQDLNRFIPILIFSCIKDKKFPCSNGNQFRDFIYVEDVISAIIKSLNSNSSNGEIINVGTGKPKKIKNIIKYVQKKTQGGTPQFGKIKMRKDEIFKIYPKLEKAKKIIKWKPKVSFTKGLVKTIKFYNEKYS